MSLYPEKMCAVLNSGAVQIWRYSCSILVVQQGFQLHIAFVPECDSNPVIYRQLYLESSRKVTSPSTKVCLVVLYHCPEEMLRRVRRPPMTL